MTLKIFYRVWPTQSAGHSHTVTNINHTKIFPSERESLYGYENSYKAKFLQNTYVMKLRHSRYSVRMLFSL